MLNPGSILARLPPSWVLRRAHCDWLWNGRDRRYASIALPPAALPCAQPSTRDTPRYRPLPKKISSPQLRRAPSPHRVPWFPLGPTECELLARCRFKTQAEARNATFAFIEGF